MKTLRRCILFSLPFVLGVPSAFAQADADDKELLGYRLSIEVVRKMDAAMEAVVTEMRKDPKFRERVKLGADIEALEKKEERTDAEETRLEQLREKLDALESEEESLLGDAETLSGMEAAIVRQPVWARALRSAGLSPREFAKASLSFWQAMMAVEMKKQGLLKELPAGISAENVRFVEAHQAELMALQKKWEALGKGR